MNPSSSSSKISHYCSLLLAGFAILLLFRPSLAAETVFFDGRPEPALLTRADRVIVTDERTTITRALPLRQKEPDTYIIPVPHGEFALRLDAIALRHIESGVIQKPEIDEIPVVTRRQIEDRFSLSEFGRFRRIRSLLLSVNTSRHINFDGKQCEIAAYTVTITHDPVAECPDCLNDSALAAGKYYRRFLDQVFIVPGVLEHFILPDSDFAGSDSDPWRPEPRLSPDFPWLKISIRNDSFYTIDGRWLSEAGIDPSLHSPMDFHLFNRGHAIPMQTIGVEGGGFTGGERLIFYARGNHSPDSPDEVYYLGLRPVGEEPARFIAGPPLDPAAPELIRFRRHLVFEQENVFEKNMGAFLSIRNMLWLWGPLSSTGTLETDFDLPGLASTSDDTTTTISLQLYSSRLSTQAGFDIDILSGSEVVAEMQMENRKDVYTFSLANNHLKQGRNTLGIRLRSRTAASIPDPVIHLDKLEVEYESFFAPREGELRVAANGAPLPVSGPARLRCIGFRSGAAVAIDLTNLSAPVLLNSESRRGQTHFAANLSPDSDLRVLEINRIPRAPAPTPSHWNPATLAHPSADIVIIHHGTLAKPARLLADSLESDGHQTMLVDVEFLYEHYSHGNLTAQAISQFLRDAVYTWPDRRPFAAILMGDCTSDGRGVARNDVANMVPIPMFIDGSRLDDKSFSTDTIYSWLNSGDEAADIVITRISSTTPDEAMAWLENRDAYRQLSQTPQPWADTLLAVNDTGEFKDAYWEIANASLSTRIDQHVLSADEFVWEDNYYLPPHLISRVEDSKVSPVLTAAIEQGFNEGAAISIFLGHGAPNLWSNQRFWFGGGTPNSDILRLENAGRFPFVTSFTCNNAVVDYPLEPWNICIAEDFMRHRGKGAIGCFMPSGPGFLTNHKVMAEGFFRAWSHLDIREHGILAELARVYQRAHDANDNNSRMFLFLGDPTLRFPPSVADEDHASAWERQAVAEGRDILIEEACFLDPLPGDPSSVRRWSYVVANNTSRPAEQEVLLLARNIANETVYTESRTLSIAPRSRIQDTFEYHVESPGLIQVSIELPCGTAFSHKAQVPTRHFRGFHVEAAPPGDAAVGILPSSLNLKPATGANTAPMLEFLVYNTGPEPRQLRFEADVAHDGTASSLARKIPSIASGKYDFIQEPLSIPAELASNVDIRYRLLDAEASSKVPLYSGTWSIDRASLCDLSILRDSVRVTPEQLSDGLTVFVDATVENTGATMSPPFEIALYKDVDSIPAKPLRDITTSGRQRSGPLFPGERRDIRLRWDPSGNAGSYDIAIIVDPMNQIPEADKLDNEVWTPLQVRSRMKLKPGKIFTFKTDDPRTLLLLAEVANIGETDARRVTVTFYHSREQNEDTLIGEVLLDRVPAEGSAEATFEWTPDFSALSGEDVDPTFTVALKGSLMRTSSVTSE